jgi:hypothetical protein
MNAPREDESHQKSSGSCVCGLVQYEIEAPYMVMQYCHCSRCRKSTGSAHAANLFVAADQLRFIQGADQVQIWDHPDAKYWRRGFCKACGSSVPYKTRTEKAWVIPGGTLDEDPGIRPVRNIFFASRAPWYVHAADLETFDEFVPR